MKSPMNRATTAHLLQSDVREVGVRGSMPGLLRLHPVGQGGPERAQRAVSEAAGLEDPIDPRLPLWDPAERPWAYQIPEPATSFTPRPCN
jgi:hypothetical protein